jgi:hypothetical protein
MVCVRFAAPVTLIPPDPIVRVEVPLREMVYAVDVPENDAPAMLALAERFGFCDVCPLMSGKTAVSVEVGTAGVPEVQLEAVFQSVPVPFQD